jgi:hypothetical protein
MDGEREGRSRTTTPSPDIKQPHCSEAWACPAWCVFFGCVHVNKRGGNDGVVVFAKWWRGAVVVTMVATLPASSRTTAERARLSSGRMVTNTVPTAGSNRDACTCSTRDAPIRARDDRCTHPHLCKQCVLCVLGTPLCSNEARANVATARAGRVHALSPSRRGRPCTPRRP